MLQPALYCRPARKTHLHQKFLYSSLQSESEAICCCRLLLQVSQLLVAAGKALKAAEERAGKYHVEGVSGEDVQLCSWCSSNCGASAEEITVLDDMLQERTMPAYCCLHMYGCNSAETRAAAADTEQNLLACRRPSAAGAAQGPASE
jgi:hypothetical protein